MKRSPLPPFIALSVVLLTGLAFLVPGLLGGAPAAPPAPPASTEAPVRRDISALIRGDMAAGVDRRIEEGHPWRPVAVPAISLLRYLLFRDLPEIVVGRAGVIYTEEEIARYAVDDRVIRDRLDRIVEYGREIRRRGSVPVVLLLPTKARIYEEYLPRRFREQAVSDRYDTALAALGAAGITTIDPRDRLRAMPPGEGFFRRDTHWTPAGAGAAAAAVAAGIRRSPFAARIDDAPVTRYEALPGVPVDVPGDLMNFLPVGDLRDQLGLPVERTRQPRFERETAPLGLFDSVEIPILLVGTSYSADQRWAFDLQVGAALSLDILNLSSAGAGPFEPMERLLAENHLEEYGARIVLWEIPERYLTIELP